ncbi:MAG: 30S ribosomal protein S6, partial [Elusimicrobia bacterium]|nr:30S ribosomal protein S6 [Elusimicrobiota bacterium]
TLEKVKGVITRAQGQISAAELWGRRKLAYTIRRNRDGYYVYVLFTAPPQVPALLDRHYRVTDTVLRGLTVKLDPRHLEKSRASLQATPETAAPVPAAPAPVSAGVQSDAPTASEGTSPSGAPAVTVAQEKTV